MNQHDGQVWFYDPASETVTLKTLFGVNPDPDVDDGTFDGPDNITVSPYGGLILAEDGEGVQHLFGVTDQGKAYPMARNEFNDSEFCGPAFSADGKHPVRQHPVPRLHPRHHRSLGMNRPGMSGDSEPWEGWSHARRYVTGGTRLS